MERYRLMEWIHYTSTELHKTFGPLFDESASAELRQRQLDLIAKRLPLVAEHLADRHFLMGEKFTCADAYLYTVLNWTHVVKFDLSPWSALQAYMKRVAQRPAVRAALKAEGLA
jgi:glutathione S-transferase